MAKKDNRVDTRLLEMAALKCLELDGTPLTKMAGRGVSKIYKMQNGKTVRLRTNNKHRLIIQAETGDAESSLKIEGTNYTDYIVSVMPKKEGTYGGVFVYKIPTKKVIEAAKCEQKKWLDRNPNTKGKNTARVFRFYEHHKFSSYDKKWKEHLLKHEVFTNRD